MNMLGEVASTTSWRSASPRRASRVAIRSSAAARRASELRWGSSLPCRLTS